MNKEKAGEIILIVLGCIAVIMLAVTMFILARHEASLQTPCEEIMEKRDSNTYVPIPKRCEKGE